MAFGFSVQTARLGLLLGVLLVLPSRPVRAQGALSQADSEADLLHRRLNLSGIKQWSPATGQWNFGYRPAKLYVVNLWSVHCPPCIAEFPLLKNIVHGWRSNPDVQFLFIADPPANTTEAEFITFWRKSLTALPEAEPYRSTTTTIREVLENEALPITLLLDQHFVIRQAFVGSIEKRRLGTAIERLLVTLTSTERAEKKAFK
jgi:thiol-disulfide isomerase/thioredoxin